MSISIYMKGDYEELHALKAMKNKANSKPICRALPGNPKLEFRQLRCRFRMPFARRCPGNPKSHVNWGGLKKQSQSVRKALPDKFINVQSSAFIGLHQDEEKRFEKTKPISERTN